MLSRFINKIIDKFFFDDEEIKIINSLRDSSNKTLRMIGRGLLTMDAREARNTIESIRLLKWSLLNINHRKD